MATSEVDPASTIVGEALKRKGSKSISTCTVTLSDERFIGEWLLFHRLIGVDHFYLYEVNGTDLIRHALAPWVKAGIVTLHGFSNELPNYQTSAMDHCSKTYASSTEWLAMIDTDEFLFPTGSLNTMNNDIREVPPPLLPMLFDKHGLYRRARALLVSRETFKNGGYQELEPHSSVMSAQVYREARHTRDEEKFTFTKNILHTNFGPSFEALGAHQLLDLSVSTIEDAGAIDVTGNHHGFICQEESDELPKCLGHYFYPGSIPHRIFEPLVIYHYVQRDLEDCYQKFRDRVRMAPTSWRVSAGSKGCLRDDIYQPSLRTYEEAESFYGGSVVDESVKASYYGRFMSRLLVALDQEGAASPLSGAGTYSIRNVATGKKLGFEPSFMPNFVAADGDGGVTVEFELSTRGAAGGRARLSDSEEGASAQYDPNCDGTKGGNGANCAAISLQMPVCGRSMWGAMGDETSLRTSQTQSGQPPPRAPTLDKQWWIFYSPTPLNSTSSSSSTQSSQTEYFM
ncbi:hypothetical protein T439DRAFT_353361 [Meredithblackwellia eburnea MCA 4105]